MTYKSPKRNNTDIIPEVHCKKKKVYIYNDIIIITNMIEQ